MDKNRVEGAIAPAYGSFSTATIPSRRQRSTRSLYQKAVQRGIAFAGTSSLPYRYTRNTFTYQGYRPRDTSAETELSRQARVVVRPYRD